MSKINPTFFIDMQKVFQTERNKSDSNRYIDKLKKCEDTILKAPTINKDVLYELQYEKTKTNMYQKQLRINKKIKIRSKAIKDRIGSINKKLKLKFRKEK